MADQQRVWVVLYQPDYNEDEEPVGVYADGEEMRRRIHEGVKGEWAEDDDGDPPEPMPLPDWDETPYPEDWVYHPHGEPGEQYRGVVTPYNKAP